MTDQAFPAIADFDSLPHEEKIRVAEARMRQMPQAFIPTQTFEGHGMVTRVMFARAGTAMIGKRHLQGQHNFLMVGTIELATEHGSVLLTAPEVIVSPPGTKRAAIAITDIVWATTLATDLPADEVEKQLIAPEDRDPPSRLEQESQS